MDESTDVKQIVDQLQQQNSELATDNLKYKAAVAASGFQDQQQDNAIQYQLDTSDILDKLEHSYRGDIISVDDEGNIDWKPQTNPELITLNEYGINFMMQTVGLYLNRITTLSYYTEDRVNEILGDLGDQIRDFIFCNYNKMGLDTTFKKAKFESLVMDTVRVIESAYRKLYGVKGYNLLIVNSILYKQIILIDSRPNLNKSQNIGIILVSDNTYILKLILNYWLLFVCVYYLMQGKPPHNQSKTWHSVGVSFYSLV